MIKFLDMYCTDCGTKLVPVMKLSWLSDKCDEFFNKRHCTNTELDFNKIDFIFFKKGEIYNYFDKLLEDKCILEFLNTELFNNVISSLSPEEINDIEQKIGCKIDVSKAVIFDKVLYFHP